MKFLHDSDFKGNILDSGIDLDTKYEPVITKLTGFNKNLGTTAGTLAEGNHGHPGIAPGAHASTHITGGLDIIPIAVAGGNAGLLSGADKTKLNGIATGANLYVHPSGTNPHGTTKSDVGLINVDNTSDINKEVATALKVRPLAMNADLHNWMPYGSVGIYTGDGSGITNAPTSDWYRYIGMSHANASGYFTIIAYAFHQPNVSFIKTCASGSWSSWSRQALISDIPATYVHPTTSGNIHIPTGGASGQVLKYSSSGVAIWSADNDTIYTHPANHPASIITQDVSNRFCTDVEKASWNSRVIITQGTVQPTSGYWFKEI